MSGFFKSFLHDLSARAHRAVVDFLEGDGTDPHKYINGKARFTTRDPVREAMTNCPVKQTASLRP